MFHTYLRIKNLIIANMKFSLSFRIRSIVKKRSTFSMRKLGNDSPMLIAGRHAAELRTNA